MHCVDLKTSPTDCDRYWRPLAISLVCLLLLSFELLMLVEYVRNRRACHSSWRAISRRLLRFMSEMHLYRRLAAVGFTAAACVNTLFTRGYAHASDGTGDEASWACLALGIFFHVSTESRARAGTAAPP